MTEKHWEAFEKWAGEGGYSLNGAIVLGDKHYVNDQTWHAYEAWKASHAGLKALVGELADALETVMHYRLRGTTDYETFKAILTKARAV